MEEPLPQRPDLLQLPLPRAHALPAVLGQLPRSTVPERDGGARPARACDRPPTDVSHSRPTSRAAFETVSRPGPTCPRARMDNCVPARVRARTPPRRPRARAGEDRETARACASSMEDFRFERRERRRELTLSIRCTFSMTRVHSLFLARSFHRAPPLVPRPLFVHSSCKPWVEVGMEAPRTSSSRASRSARRIAATVARRNGPATSHLRADS